MGRKSDVTEWQKGAIVCGKERGHSIQEVVEFVRVLLSTLTFVHLKWKKK